MLFRSDLILGLQKTTRKAGSRGRYFQTFPKALRDRLERYLHDGGKLLVSGSYLASEIIEADSLTRDSMMTFAVNTLGYLPFTEGVNDSIPKAPVATRSMEIKGSEIMPGMPVIRTSSLASFRNGNWAGAGNPQAIIPADKQGLVIARYADTGYPAAIAVDNGDKAGRAVIASFPIEAMENEAAREGFVGSAVSYLIGPEAPAPAAVKPTTAPVSDLKEKQGKTDKNKKKKKKKEDKKASKNKKKQQQAASEVKDGKSPVPKPARRDPDTPRAVPHRRK